MNEERSLFIVRSFLFSCSVLMILSCGPNEPSSGSGTGSSEKGMLEEKDPKADLQGRIKTLKSKFKELKKPPDRLSSSSKERWNKKVRRADSLLERLGKKVQRDGAAEKKAKLRIDRTLQRLGIQARSMQKALQKGKERSKDHP